MDYISFPEIHGTKKIGTYRVSAYQMVTPRLESLATRRESGERPTNSTIADSRLLSYTDGGIVGEMLNGYTDIEVCNSFVAQMCLL